MEIDDLLDALFRCYEIERNQKDLGQQYHVDCPTGLRENFKRALDDYIDQRLRQHTT